LHKFIRITEDARNCFKISREIGHGHGNRHGSSREAGCEPNNQKQTPEAFDRAREVRVQSWERDTKTDEKIGHFSDIGEVTFAGHKELPKKIDSQHQQEW